MFVTKYYTNIIRGHVDVVVTLLALTFEVCVANHRYYVVGCCLPIIGSLQYRTLINYMYCFHLQIKLSYKYKHNWVL